MPAKRPLKTCYLCRIKCVLRAVPGDPILGTKTVVGIWCPRCDYRGA